MLNRTSSLIRTNSKRMLKSWPDTSLASGSRLPIKFELPLVDPKNVRLMHTESTNNTARNLEHESAIKELIPLMKEIPPALKELTPAIKELTPSMKELKPALKEMNTTIKESKLPARDPYTELDDFDKYWKKQSSYARALFIRNLKRYDSMTSKQKYDYLDVKPEKEMNSSGPITEELKIQALKLEKEIKTIEHKLSENQKIIFKKITHYRSLLEQFPEHFKFDSKNLINNFTKENSNKNISLLINDIAFNKAILESMCEIKNGNLKIKFRHNLVSFSPVEFFLLHPLSKIMLTIYAIIVATFVAILDEDITIGVPQARDLIEFLLQEIEEFDEIPRIIIKLKETKEKSEELKVKNKAHQLFLKDLEKNKKLNVKQIEYILNKIHKNNVSIYFLKNLYEKLENKFDELAAKRISKSFEIGQRLNGDYRLALKTLISYLFNKALKFKEKRYDKVYNTIIHFNKA